MDVYESATDNLVTAVLELPGMTKENVSIDVQGNQLVVTGEQRQERERAEGNYVQKERPAGKYFRTLPLPSGTRVSLIVSVRICDFFGTDSVHCRLNQLRRQWKMAS